MRNWTQNNTRPLFVRTCCWKWQLPGNLLREQDVLKERILLYEQNRKIQCMKLPQRKIFPLFVENDRWFASLLALVSFCTEHISLVDKHQHAVWGILQCYVINSEIVTPFGFWNYILQLKLSSCKVIHHVTLWRKVQFAFFKETKIWFYAPFSPVTVRQRLLGLLL